MIRSSILNCHRGLATAAKTTGTASVNNSAVFNTAVPPSYTLASLRSFPNLEPQTFIPLPASYLASPTRRDFLWQAVVYEADKARVGSGNVPTKGDKPFSNKKLLPQKGTGKARTGDGNSPIRFNGLKPFGIKAGHDWSTRLPAKIYNRGFQTAFGDKYKQGKLMISESLDLPYGYPEQMKQFVDFHQLDKRQLLFITNSPNSNLVEATEGVKADVIAKEAVEVRDILKANRVYIELSALQWFIGKFE